MKYIYTLLIILITIIFIGCENKFSQVVDFELPDHEPRIVSYCFVEANNPLIKIDISKSLGVLEDDKSSIDQANIQMYKNDQLFIDEFQHDLVFIGIDYNNPNEMDSIFKNVYSANIPEVIKEDDVLRLEISSPGLEDVSAEASLSQKVLLTSVQFEKDGYVDPEGYTSDEIEIQFSDPGNTDNYYLITADRIAENPQGNDTFNIYLDTSDPRLETADYLKVLPDVSNNFVFFEDKEGFNGENNTLKFSTYVYKEIEDVHLRVRLFSISKDLFHFISAYNLYEENGDNIFAEPVIINSNFINGFGLFALYSYDEIEIKL